MNNEIEQNQGNLEPETPSTLGAPEYQPEVADDTSPFDGNSDNPSNEFSFEDVVFGDNQSGTKEQPVETHNESQGVPQEPSQVTTKEEQVQTESNNPNDANRYEYWQSQAMKAQNELQSLQTQWGPVVQQATLNAQTAQPAPNVDTQPVQEEEFPEPPVKPTKPRSFSRTEAIEDSSSDSAKYLDEIDEWRDEIDDYTALKGDYQAAVMDEKLQSIENERAKSIESAKKRNAESQQMNKIHNHVTTKYGFDAEHAAKFVQWGARPENLSMDNLVQLYKIQNGQGTMETNGAVRPPSDNFQQVARAAEVKSPMGVMPAQTNTPQPKDPGSGLMEGLINYANKGNDIF
jgi:hypothetical protein